MCDTYLERLHSDIFRMILQYFHDQPELLCSYRMLHPHTTTYRDSELRRIFCCGGQNIFVAACFSAYRRHKYYTRLHYNQFDTNAVSYLNYVPERTVRICCSSVSADILQHLLTDFRWNYRKRRAHFPNHDVLIGLLKLFGAVKFTPPNINCAACRDILNKIHRLGLIKQDKVPRSLMYDIKQIEQYFPSTHDWRPLVDAVKYFVMICDMYARIAQLIRLESRIPPSSTGGWRRVCKFERVALDVDII